MFPTRLLNYYVFAFTLPRCEMRDPEQTKQQTFNSITNVQGKTTTKGKMSVENFSTLGDIATVWNINTVIYLTKINTR